MSSRISLTYSVILLLFVVGTPCLFAQENSDSLRLDRLTLSESIEVALKHNHGIEVARNRSQISENNATIGNAGYLPRIDFTGSANHSIMNTRTEFGGAIPNQDRKNSESTQYNSAVELTYTIFDGFGNRYRFNSLKTQAELSNAQSLLQIEQTLLDVINGHLQVIGAKQNKKISRQAMEISAERYQRARKQYEMGGRSRVNLLNARVALNQDSVRYIEDQSALREAKRSLLVQLGQSPTDSITIDTEFEIDRSLALTDLLQRAIKENEELSMSRLETEMAEWNVRQMRSRQYPTVNLSGSYSYSRTEQEAGILQFQRSNGFSGGISLRFNLFNGFQQSIDRQNAELRLKNSEQQRRQTRKQIRKRVLNIYEQYKTNLVLLDKQQLNVETAQLNFERTREAFQLGQVTNTEFRQAQLNLLRTRQQLIQAKIGAKQMEIRLLQLAGKLIEDKRL